MNILSVNLSRKNISDSFWSFFGNFISVFAGLAGIKIITKFVAPNDYGMASLVLGIVALLNTLLLGPLMVVHMRIYFDYLELGMAQWYSKSFRWVMGGMCVVSIIIYFIVAYVYQQNGNNVFISLFAPIFLLIIAQSYMGVTKSYLEAHKLYRRLAIVNILHKILQPFMLIGLLFFVVPGSISIVLSYSLAIIPLLLIFSKIDAHQVSNKIPRDTKKALLKLKKAFLSFGWALPLSYFVQWLLSTSDRYLIDYFMSVKNVGIYAINYSFWATPFLILNGWLEILTRPRLYDKAVKKNQIGMKSILQKRVFIGILFSFLGTIALYFWGESIASIMLGKEYWGGKKIMMSIAIAHLFMVLSYSVLPMFLATKRTMAILWAYSLAAIVNIAANVILIPWYGMLGAAISTLIGYLISSIVLVLWVCVIMSDENKSKLFSEQDNINPMGTEGL